MQRSRSPWILTFAKKNTNNPIPSLTTSDGPIRPPYTIYCQGGTHWTLWVNVLQSVLTALAQLE